MTDRPVWYAWTRPALWVNLGLTAFVCLLLWSMAHQVSPPVIESCRDGTAARPIAPPFDRTPKPEKP